MSNSDAQFLRDVELNNLLERWSAPEPSRSLDDRVSAAYRQMVDNSARLSPSLQSQRGSEVVTMKVCSTCHEEFADRFSFCPVDGSPLTLKAIEPEPTPALPEIEASYPIAESAAYQRSAPEIPAAPV